jgi:hypothetical protein
MHRTLARTLLLLAALTAAGCDNEIDNPLDPEEPAPTVTETFTGSMNINGAQTHTFAVLARGTVTATLTELTPVADPVTQVGLHLGNWNGSTCSTVIANNAAVQGNAVIGNVAGLGTLCVRIHDVGRLTESINYTITVVHP